MDSFKTLNIVVSETVCIGITEEVIEYFSRIYRSVIQEVLFVLRESSSVNLFSRPPTGFFTILDMQKLLA